MLPSAATAADTPVVPTDPWYLPSAPSFAKRPDAPVYRVPPGPSTTAPGNGPSRGRRGIRPASAPAGSSFAIVSRSETYTAPDAPTEAVARGVSPYGQIASGRPSGATARSGRTARSGPRWSPTCV